MRRSGTNIRLPLALDMAFPSSYAGVLRQNRLESPHLDEVILPCNQHWLGRAVNRLLFNVTLRNHPQGPFTE